MAKHKDKRKRRKAPATSIERIDAIPGSAPVPGAAHLADRYKLPATGNYAGRKPPGPDNPLYNVVSPGKPGGHKYTQADLDEFYSERTGCGVHLDQSTHIMHIAAYCTAEQPWTEAHAQEIIRLASPPKGWQTETIVKHAMHGTGVCEHCGATEGTSQNKLVAVRPDGNTLHYEDTGFELPAKLTPDQARQAIARAMQDPSPVSLPDGLAQMVVPMGDHFSLATFPAGTPVEDVQSAVNDLVASSMPPGTTVGQQAPAYVLQAPFTPEQVAGLVADIVPRLDADGMLDGGNGNRYYVVVADPDGTNYRLTDWLRRQAPRVPPPGSAVYAMDGTPVGTVVAPRQGGGVDVVSAEGLDANTAAEYGITPAMLKEVQDSGVAMAVQEDAYGNLRTAKGQHAIDIMLQRQQYSQHYAGHPLLQRYHQMTKAAMDSRNPIRNTEPWHAIAEKYGMLMAAANMGSAERTHMYLDPGLASHLRGNLTEEEVGMYLAKCLDEAVPYLWLSQVADMCDALPLPAHTITRGLHMPHTTMFWSFEVAHGPEEARIDWLLVMQTKQGIEVWCPIVDDRQGHQTGKSMVTAVSINYGAKWPASYPEDKYGSSIVAFVLRRLAFLASKWTDARSTPSERHVRRQVERQLTKLHKPLPDTLSAYVVELRAREQRPHLSLDVSHVPKEINRQHCWWVVGHNMVRYRGTAQEQVVYQPPHIRGPLDMPLLQKTYRVAR